MLKIKRQGIIRICSESDYKRKFKSLGFEIVEDEKPEKEFVQLDEDDYKELENEVDFSELSEDEIRDLAKENDIGFYWNSSIDTLKEKLSEVL